MTMSDEIDAEIAEALDAARAEIAAYVEEAKDELEQFVEDLKDDDPDTPGDPEPEGPSAADLNAWTGMQDQLMVDHPGLSREDADTMLDTYFTDIKEGRRDENGNYV